MNDASSMVYQFLAIILYILEFLVSFGMPMECLCNVTIEYCAFFQCSINTYKERFKYMQEVKHLPNIRKINIATGYEANC